jgi:hypothetical protein
MKNPKTVTREDIERRNAELDAEDRKDSTPAWDQLIKGLGDACTDPGSHAFPDYKESDIVKAQKFAEERATEVNTSTPGKPWGPGRHLLKIDKLELAVDALVERVEKLEEMHEIIPSPGVKWPTAEEFRQEYAPEIDDHYEWICNWFRSQIEPQLKGDK